MHCIKVFSSQVKIKGLGFILPYKQSYYHYLLTASHYF